MKLIITSIAALWTTVGVLSAQHGHHSAEPTGIHDHHAHHHHDRNEIGVSTGALYGLDHKEWGPGIHLHYMRTLGDHSRWALGAFGEYAWLGKGHYSLGAGVKYEPVDRLHLGVFPGVIVARHEDEHRGHSHGEGWKTRFSAHFEVVYDLFHFGDFHLGPALDYSWSKHDSHLMTGVHFAFGF